jgi:drug/metabolite transporter (DMT)-like permease
MDWLKHRFIAFSVWMLAYFLAYIAVAIAIRYLSHSFRIVEIAAIRSAGSLILAGFFVFRSKAVQRQLSGMQFGYHVQRSLIHLIGSLALIWSLANLPLGFIATIEFSGPLFAALLGLVVAGLIPGPAARLGLSLIAVGSAYLLFSQGVSHDARLLIPVGAVALLTVTNLMLVRLAESKSVVLIVFVMHAVQLPVYLCALLIGLDVGGAAQPRDGHLEDVLGVSLAVGVLMSAGFVTQTALANASRYGSALQLCAADTLRVPFLTLIGYFVFKEMLSESIVLPGLLVVAGAIITSLPQPRAQSRKS